MIMTSITFCSYVTTIALLFNYRQEITSWSTLQQNVDTPLTVEAFNNVFISFISLFCAYAFTALFGLIALGLKHRKLVRIYHVANWFFVLLIFTVNAAFWIYFKVKQDVYVNDCQDLRIMHTNATLNPFYTPIQLSGKQIVAGGSDKSECIDLIKDLVIVSGVFLFVFNFVQIYWARSIGKYATSFKRNYWHYNVQAQNDDVISARSEPKQ
ncbi:unnamed protein product [Mucor hiemalis]